jgi:NADH:ubiquinone oxidoreductase subunit 6 (subunit J)
MFRGRVPAPLPLPVPVWVIFWGIAALTLAFAWPARYDTNRGYSVLAISLLAVAVFYFTLP